MYDIIVVGAGPAGLTASIYAKRAGKSVLVLEKEVFGGQITYSPCVENYPGFEKISGAELADHLVEQSKLLGAQINFESVSEIIDGKIKTVITDSHRYECKSVIIATGARHRHLGLDGEERFTGKGVSYCAVCDGAFFRGKDVFVVGGGDAALQDAVFLSERCSHVGIIHRRDSFRGEAHLVKILKERENVSFIMNCVVTSLKGDKKLSEIEVKNVVSGKTETLSADGIFIAVGQEPQNAPFENLISLDRNGYAISGENCTTKTDGIFVAGDCRTKEIRQLTTAVSDGTVAAIQAINYINNLK